MLTFDSVTKVYGDDSKKVTAIDNITFHVDQGDICVLLGPSGCGKTTLLRIVNRLVSLSSGTVKVNDKDIQSLDLIELRRSIGYVIQQNGLFPNMTIEENICVVPKLLGWDRTKMKKRSDELLDLFGLQPDQFKKRYPWELSGGQQQRVGIARALAADPPIMLMDEPFGALDPVIREHIQNEFLRIQEDVKKTILFVSHDIDEAIRIADKIAIMKNGSLMQYASPNEVLASPKNDFVRDFIGGDSSLKRLSLFTVQDLLKESGNLRKITGNQRGELNTVRLDDNLRKALSIILASSAGEAYIVDESNERVGILSITDLSAFSSITTNEMSGIL